MYIGSLREGEEWGQQNVYRVGSLREGEGWGQQNVYREFKGGMGDSGLGTREML